MSLFTDVKLLSCSQVKQGAESMIAKYTSGSGSSSRDKKLHQEAMAMLDDSKRKIEYIRMQQLLLRSKIHGTQSGVCAWLYSI